MTFTAKPAGTRMPSAHLCPIEWAPDIEISLATLYDFVADVDSGNLDFDAEAIEAVRWALDILWFSAGACAGNHLEQVQGALSAPRIDFEHAAGLMLPFVDEMKPRIEKRIAVAAKMMAKYC